MRYIHKELIALLFMALFILYFNNRYLEAVFLVAAFALFIRLRYILKDRGFEDNGSVFWK